MVENLSEPKSKIWLWVLVVVVVLILGGTGYGYYTWQKANEPPPSLETVDGSGLQGLMKVQEGDLTGYVKFEEADVPTACTGTSVRVSKGMNYLYSTSQTTFKDFYDAVAVKGNVGRTFLFLFYSPGETVKDTKYDAGFYFYPTDKTIYKATHVALADGGKYVVPSYRSVVFYNDGEMEICGDKIKAALGKETMTEQDEKTLLSSLDPFPKGWVLVPFGWNMEYIGFFGSEFGDYITSTWVQVGGEVTKVKESNVDKLETALGSSNTRSVWLKTSKEFDLPALVAAGQGGGTGGESVLKNECDAGFKCVREENSCLKLPTGEQVCVSLDGACDRVKCGEGTVCELIDPVLDAVQGKIAAPAEAKCVVEIPEGEAKCEVPGDVDEDGKVDCDKDTAALEGIFPGGGAVTPCADVNGDGSIDISDVQKFVLDFCPEPVVAEAECGVDKACTDEGAVCYKVPVEGGGETFDCLTRDKDPCAEHPAPVGMECSVNNMSTPKAVLWSEIPLFDQMLSTDSGIMTHKENFYGVYGKSLWKGLFEGEQLSAYKNNLISYMAGAEDSFSVDGTDAVSVPVSSGYNVYNVVSEGGILSGDIYSYVKPVTIDGADHYMAVLWNSGSHILAYPGTIASSLNLSFVKEASGVEMLPQGASFVLYSSKATELYGTSKFSPASSDQAMVFYYLSGPGKIVNFVEGENVFRADKDLKLSDILGLLEMNVTNLGNGLGIAFVYGNRGSDTVSVYPPKLADYFNGLVKIEDPSTFNISNGAVFSIFSTGAVQIPPSGFSVTSLD
jgi:hypothetical protein